MNRVAETYLIVISLVSFALFGIDKQKAVHHAWRIPESILILSAAAGGGIGALLGMRCFHHKTRKPLFSIGIPVILCLEILVLLKAYHII